MAEPVLDGKQRDLHYTVDRRRLVRGVVVALLAFLSCFFVAGFNEQFGLTQIALLVGVCIWLRTRPALYGLVGAVAGFAVVALAPGNTVRSALLTGGQPFTVAFAQAFYYPLFYTVRIAREHPISLVVAFLMGWIAGQGKIVRRRLRWGLILLLSAWILMAVGLFPSLWIGGVLIPRIFIVAQLILTLALAGAGYLVACRKR